ncbi:MAG: YbbR-like domain-containing protein [Bacteroidaceae bacterium]|nr:YbbR-like domain-containing protein [Bacteroidaceae bacterium]
MKRLLEMTGNVLSRLLNHDALIFLFFLAVAGSFWLSQTLNETLELEVRVPLRLDSVPENVMITTEPPKEITAIVRDRGTTLVRYWRRKETKPVVLNFASYDNGSVAGRIQIPHSTVLHAVEETLDGTSHVQSLQPDTIEFYYNRGLRYRLPVRVLGTVTTTPQGYLLGLETNPDSVEVYAPTAILDTMRAAYTKAVNMTELSTTVTSKTQLVTIKGVKYEPQEVDVTAHVDFYTEKVVEVPIIGLNFPAEKTLRTFPAKARVTFRIGSAQFQLVNSENFVLAVTYEELLRNPGPKYRLHLKSLPPGVSNVRISPQEVDYLIENVASDDSEE